MNRDGSRVPHLLLATLLAGCTAARPAPASPTAAQERSPAAVHTRQTLVAVLEEAARDVAPGAELRVTPYLVGWGTNPGEPWTESLQLTRAGDAPPDDFEGTVVEFRAAACGWRFASERTGDGVLAIELVAGPYLAQLGSVEPMLVARGEVPAAQRVLEVVPLDALAKALARRIEALPPGSITPRCPLGSGG